MINISGIPKEKVLIALYENAKCQGLGYLQYNSAPMKEEEACHLLSQHTYFDYLNGRVMKVNLSSDELDPYLYDRDNGEGAAQKAIDSISL